MIGTAVFEDGPPERPALWVSGWAYYPHYVPWVYDQTLYIYGHVGNGHYRVVWEETLADAKQCTCDYGDAPPHAHYDYCETRHPYHLCTPESCRFYPPTQH